MVSDASAEGRTGAKVAIERAGGRKEQKEHTACAELVRQALRGLHVVAVAGEMQWTRMSSWTLAAPAPRWWSPLARDARYFARGPVRVRVTNLSRNAACNGVATKCASSPVSGSSNGKILEEIN